MKNRHIVGKLCQQGWFKVNSDPWFDVGNGSSNLAFRTHCDCLVDLGLLTLLPSLQEQWQLQEFPKVLDLFVNQLDRPVLFEKFFPSKFIASSHTNFLWCKVSWLNRKFDHCLQKLLSWFHLLPVCLSNSLLNQYSHFHQHKWHLDLRNTCYSRWIFFQSEFQKCVSR